MHRKKSFHYSFQLFLGYNYNRKIVYKKSRLCLWISLPGDIDNDGGEGAGQDIVQGSVGLVLYLKYNFSATGLPVIQIYMVVFIWYHVKRDSYATLQLDVH